MGRRSILTNSQINDAILMRKILKMTYNEIGEFFNVSGNVIYYSLNTKLIKSYGNRPFIKSDK